jgi:topoisomerase IA-like protein
MSRLYIAAVLIVTGAWSLAAQPQTANIVPGVATTVAPPKTKQSAFTTIQGNALDSTNSPMSGALVRLRDARFGRIVDTQLTDKAGLFAFRSVEPGSYIVELLGKDQSILAASQLLNVSAGDAVSALVKLPLRIPPFAGVLGGTTTSSAGAIATQAVASGIVAVIPTKPVSPNQ